ncbi:MAG: efflux RND transporter permease subunit [Marinilabiliales bacterium]|nr:efflux RND transporter permease subunit [Marinilabiliales bacterium]
MQDALIEGGVFVVIILFIFLGSFRTTVIYLLLAIPSRCLGHILVLKLLGLNINTMSLGGMAIAIGALVDDAIIDVENVYKRLRQNRQKPRRAATGLLYGCVTRPQRKYRASNHSMPTTVIIVAFTPLVLPLRDGRKNVETRSASLLHSIPLCVA